MPKEKRKPSHVRHKASSSVKFVYKPPVSPKSADEVMLNVMEIIRQAGIAYIALKERNKRKAEDREDLGVLKNDQEPTSPQA